MTTPPVDSRSILNVSLAERSYPIHFGHRSLHQLGALAKQACQKISHAVCIFDAAVGATHAHTVLQSLTSEGIRVNSIEIPSGEGSKSIDQLARVWEQLLACRSDRSTIIVAIGGGVVGDLAGFAAASFARGVRLVQVPTTLLSQVDSSVGGKTGINLPNAKNIVGAFWQPAFVAIDTQTLDTLPDREFLSGLAEVVKYSIIMNAPFLEWLEEHVDPILARDPNILSHMIRRCCECKASIVSQDERETTGLRAILNYGHTFGHAMEAATSYGELLHGEAIAIGMTMAAKLAFQLGRVDHHFLTRQTHLLERFHLPTRWSGSDPSQLWELMQHDKKVHHGSLSFILPCRIGCVESVSNVTREAAIQAMLS